MILKDADEKKNLSKFEQYGHKAEQQMAFYLKRKFQYDTNVHVINDLRLELYDDVAQIDHLIVHPYGFIIIESKSVTAKISINKHGEWQRHYQKYSKGMPSPLNQAKRQMDILLSLLELNSESLLRKKLIFNFNIKKFKFDLLIAISDDGIIDRPESLELNEVLKADQISDNIEKKIADYKKLNKSLFTSELVLQFLPETMNKVSKFLLKSHSVKEIEPKVTYEKKVEPPKKVAEPKKPVKVAEPKEAKYELPSCKACKSHKLQIAYGKFGYYFKCSDCDKNTSLKLKCTTDKCKPKLKKSKLNFFQICEHCDSSKLYFTNKAAES